MVKISVIIPVYNTGEYLHKCIKSVLVQELSELELILVDDGSTDKSGKICDFYAEEDSRIKVIHKKNEGVSIARNTALAVAEGEYIGFVDSDDWIDAAMYKEMYEKARQENADVVICDAVTKYDDRADEEDTITQLKTSLTFKKEEIKPSLLCELAGSACRCIYKNELLKENGIVFPLNLKLSEDRIFNIYAMGKSEKLAYIKKAFYNRYVRKGSAVNKYYENMADIVLDGNRRIMKALNETWEKNEAYITAYEAQSRGMFYTAINNEFYKENKKSFLKKYKEVKRICNIYELQKAVKGEKKDFRALLIEKKCAFALCAVAILLNKKHGR